MLPSLWQSLRSTVEHTRVPHPEQRLINAAGLTIDVTAQHWSPEVGAASERILDQHGFCHKRHDLLSGGIVNPTEQRAAWHTALRAAATTREVATERQRMLDFVRLADTERRWRNVVHIGIGGSDWGVRLAIAAFGYAGTWRNVRFAANIDGHAMAGALAGLDPNETLVVVASKSFTTTETLQNASRALEWLKGAGISDPFQHIVAITARPQVAQQWGVKPGHIFQLWDWVGGRFSLWSSVSLTIALAVGIDTVAGLHAGAAAMDHHFATAPLAANAPVQMAISGVINRSLLGYGSLNISPYDYRLGYLVPYIQQLDMESLGKSVDLQGKPVQLPTGPAVWGMPGTDAQHTFFQWLHQGSDGAPVDFIVCQNADHQWPDHHTHLIANCLAQREALLRGKSVEQAYAEGLAEGRSPEQAQELAHHRTHPGGRPSTLIVLPKLSPYTLGALLALYEHKIFTQGVMWNINPFDQWGVEYGKVLAGGLLGALKGETDLPPSHDASTLYWVNRFRHREA